MCTVCNSNAILCEQTTTDCDVKEPLCVPRTKHAYFCTIHCSQLSNMAELVITSQSHHDVVKSATTLFCSNVQDLIWRCIILHSTHLLLQLTEFTENWVTLQNTATNSSSHENNENKNILDSNYGLTAKMKLLPVVIKWCYISNCYKIGWNFSIPGFYLMQAQSYLRAVILFTCNTTSL